MAKKLTIKDLSKEDLVRLISGTMLERFITEEHIARLIISRKLREAEFARININKMIASYQKSRSQKTRNSIVRRIVVKREKYDRLRSDIDGLANRFPTLKEELYRDDTDV